MKRSDGKAAICGEMRCNSRGMICMEVSCYGKAKERCASTGDGKAVKSLARALQGPA